MVVIIVVCVVVVVVVAGLLVLRGLASGAGAARRFSTDKPSGTLQDYLERGASFAVTAEVHSDRPATELWSALVAAGSLDGVFLCAGPAFEGESSVVGTAWAVRTPIAALGGRIAAVEPGHRITYLGSGLSIPLTLSSFAMQYTLDASSRGSVIVHWTIAGTPRWIGFMPLRWTAVVIRPFLRSALKSVLRPH